MKRISRSQDASDDVACLLVQLLPQSFAGLLFGTEHGPFAEPGGVVGAWRSAALGEATEVRRNDPLRLPLLPRLLGVARCGQPTVALVLALQATSSGVTGGSGRRAGTQDALPRQRTIRGRAGQVSR